MMTWTTFTHAAPTPSVHHLHHYYFCHRATRMEDQINSIILGYMGASSEAANHQNGGSDEQQRRLEIYTYEAPWHIYAMNWSVQRDKRYRLAIASLLEQFLNRVEIVQLDNSNGEIRSDPTLLFEHPYPPTKAIFIPDKECQKPHVLATSIDFLHVWRILFR